MRQVFFAMLVLTLASASGCKLCNGLGWKHGCHDGACGEGACAHGGCPDGACDDCGHASPYELFHGHAPVQRGGLLDHLHASALSGPAVIHGGGHGFGGRRGMGGEGGLGGRRGRGDGMDGMAGAGGMGGPQGLQPTPPPSAGNVSYPYYTTRGPRDFLAPNPRGIGP